MNTQCLFTHTHSRVWDHPLLLFGSVILPLLATAFTALGGSATWNLNPTSNDWNTASNWTPETVPNQITDVATFGVSSVTDASTSSYVLIGGVVFTPGASSYHIVADMGIDGDGVINNSGVIQNFSSSQQDIAFGGNATAGSEVIFTNNGETVTAFGTALGAGANAGSATFINKGDSAELRSALMYFRDHSSAASSTIINESGDTHGAITEFHDHASAGNSNISLQPGAELSFDEDTTGGSATLIADGGQIYFMTRSNGELARVELLNGGVLGLEGHSNTAVMAIGSLEGDSTSTVRLGTQKLTIGGNGLSTTFSGVIFQNGSLVKTGSERLTLTGASTYSGGTTISAGLLQVNNRTASATGTGAVNVSAGTLSGKGTISGAVTVGTGTGSGAFLAPGTTRPDTLTLSKTLTFKNDGTYNCELALGQAKADQVSANGVTIESGAQFVFLPTGIQRLTRGTVFTVISNTATTAISGTFANLPDGSKLSTGAGNKLQVSYEGGDGNDLTLTVVR